MYCVVKVNENYGKIYQGSASDIVNQIFKITINEEDWQLTVEVDNYNPRSYHSYNKEAWTREEMYSDIVKFLFGKIKDYGYIIYRKKK